jgi:transposase
MEGIVSEKRYIVRLTEEERQTLQCVLRKGTHPARRLLKAQILLRADASESGEGWTDVQIMESLGASASMVYRVRQQFVEEGLEATLARKKRETPPVAPVFDGEKEAKLIAIACSKAPEGRCRWTLQLLADHLVALNVVDEVSASTVARTLKKTNLSLT